MTEPGALPAAGGSYLLWLELDQPTVIEPGRLGRFELAPGYYGYCGSAFGPGGLAARVGRHLRGGPVRHWHIDHLRAVAELREVWWCADPRRFEHQWAEQLLAGRGRQAAIPRFGASDCRCASHLVACRRMPGFDGFRCRLAVSVPGRAPLLLRRAFRIPARTHTGSSIIPGDHASD